MKKIRCAIYTRKSSEEGLEQEFNSLDAQREACAAYIASQKHEGWVLLPEHYDDGGLSGGNMERPALQQLLADVDEGLVDQIIVYKVDRLTRSLADFAKLVDRLDQVEASFVSVTQSFNTATSMGRLTLNVLLSFAQFEREVTAERIRDKIAASKRKGLWMGGNVPLGYQPDGRTLKIIDTEAQTIRKLYDLYIELGDVRSVRDAAIELGLTTKRSAVTQETPGKSFTRGHIHYILTNPLYAGRIRHKTQIYPGKHKPIIEPTVWEDVQSKLIENAKKGRAKQTLKVDQSKLCGKLFDENGAKLTPSHSNKRGKRYRYYVSHNLIKDQPDGSRSNWRLPAQTLEDAILNAASAHIRQNYTSILDPTAPLELIQVFATKVAATANSKNKQQGLIEFEHVQRVDINPGALRIQLDAQTLAVTFEIGGAAINEEILKIELPFTQRKRGVETKLLIGTKQTNHDPILVNNLAKANKIHDLVKSGQSFDQISKALNISKPRITELIKLAFLSPSIVDPILKGEQKIELTSDRILKSRLPMDWEEQQTMLGLS